MLAEVAAGQEVAGAPAKGVLRASGPRRASCVDMAWLAGAEWGCEERVSALAAQLPPAGAPFCPSVRHTRRLSWAQGRACSHAAVC